MRVHPLFLPEAEHLVPRTVSSMPSSFLRRFIRTEAFSGLAVLLAATVAVAWANIGESYASTWATELSFGVGELYIQMDLAHLIGEVAMSAFFLLIGLEVRRELTHGHLSSASARIAPLVASIAGTVLPAIIYLSIAAPAQRRGWAIPTATDIALVIGMFALLARRLHPGTRVMLLSIAVIDDVIGIGLLAVLSSGSMKWSPILAAAALTVLGYLAARWRGLPVPLLLVLWVALLELLHSGGIHPTLSGVLVAVVASAGPATSSDAPSSVERLEAALHPWVSYLVLPAFVLSHAGVGLGGADRTAAAVAVALIVGKPVAVFGSLWIGCRFGWLRLPSGLGVRDLAVLGALCGGGLTVSSLIATASLSTSGPAILGVLIGTVVSLVLASLLTLLPATDTGAHAEPLGDEVTDEAAAVMMEPTESELHN